MVPQARDINPFAKVNPSLVIKSAYGYCSLAIKQNIPLKARDYQQQSHLGNMSSYTFNDSGRWPICLKIVDYSFKSIPVVSWLERVAMECLIPQVELNFLLELLSIELDVWSHLVPECLIFKKGNQSVDNFCMRFNGVKGMAHSYPVVRS